MKLTNEGIALIKEFEGCRLAAYRCAAGVLTIGYGHTSMAGPPEVTPNLRITQKEAEAILIQDLAIYQRGVRAAIKGIDLPDDSFSACVSLAFNIGVEAFRNSSVARFILAGRYDDAADAFLLWNKAGKHVLPGLTRRRAAEAALFRTGFETEPEPIRPALDPPKGKPLFLSSTNIAAGASAAAGVTAAAREVIENTGAILSASNLIIFSLIAVIVAGTIWIFRERAKKARDWAV